MTIPKRSPDGLAPPPPARPATALGIDGTLSRPDPGRLRMNFERVVEPGDYDLVVTHEDGSVQMYQYALRVEPRSPIALTALSLGAPAPGSSAEAIVDGHNLAEGMELEFSDPAVTATPLALDASGVAHTTVRVSPLASPGAVAARLRIPSAHESDWLAQALTIEAIVPTPEVTRVRPGRAEEGATLTVTVFGEHLDAATAVEFGTRDAGGVFTADPSVAVEGFDLISSTALAVELDLSSALPRSYAVRVSGGGRPDAELNQALVVTPQEVAQPDLRLIFPSAGLPDTTRRHLILGEQLPSDVEVAFGALDDDGTFIPDPLLSVADQIWHDDRALEIVLSVDGAAALGPRDVRLIGAGWPISVFAAGAFTVEDVDAHPALPLVIDEVDPEHLAAGDSAELTIAGSGFSDTLTVEFGSFESDSFTADAAIGVEVLQITDETIVLQVTVAAEAAPGAREIRLRDEADEREAIELGLFSIVEGEEEGELLFAAVEPNESGAHQQLLMKISGAGFTGDLRVRVGLGADEGSFEDDPTIEVAQLLVCAEDHAVALLTISEALPGDRTIRLDDLATGDVALGLGAFAIRPAATPTAKPLKSRARA